MKPDKRKLKMNSAQYEVFVEIETLDYAISILEKMRKEKRFANRISQAKALDYALTQLSTTVKSHYALKALALRNAA
jgi:hypothetical protein